MKTHLSEVITPQQSSRQRSSTTLVVLEHNLTRSSVPFLRALLNTPPKEKGVDFRVLLICLLHAPSVLIANVPQDGHFRVLDFTGCVSNFGIESNAANEAPRTSSEVLAVIQEG
jgi:hypothetical protein